MIKTKRFLSLFLVLCMCIGMLPMSAFATSKETVCDVESQSTDSFSRILHLDCGRKYFTKDWIIALINEMAAAGYNQLQLAFGNEGMRFLLDDMSVTVNGTTYSDDAVTAGIQVGNRNYYNFSVNELTQTEMTEIITYAQSRGIEIVPHMNMPGHMNAILDAIEYVGISDAHFTGSYATSSSSLNLNNDTAVAFAKALLTKYVNYFKAKGCNYFHIGADEFANDGAYGPDTMGFPNMGSALYTKFAAYVNDCAGIVESVGMTPRAWNDGLYFPGSYFETYSETFDSDIQITYWSSGWTNGYNVASASTQSGKGHDMINTNGDYYYVLGKGDQWDSYGYTYAANWSNTAFMGSTVSNPVGSMFCIWCDYPNAETETQIAANTRLVLRAMAAEMQGNDAYSISTDVISGGFKADGTINYADLVTKTDSATNVSVTACGLTGLTVMPVTANVPTVEGASDVTAWEMTPATAAGNYSGSATVSVPVPVTWTEVRGGVLESANGPEVMDITGTLTNGVFTFNVPHFSTVLAYNLSRAGEGDEGDVPESGGNTSGGVVDTVNHTVELNVGDTATFVIKNITDNGSITTTPTGIANVSAKYVAGEGTSETPVTSVTAGESYYLKNDADQYMKADATFTGDIAEAAKWTLVTSTNGYMIHNENNKYLFYENGWVLFDGWGDDFKFLNGKLVDYYVASQSLTPVAGGGTVDQSTITVTGVSSGTTKATIGGVEWTINVHDTVNITIKYQTENGTLIKSETVSVADNATSYPVSSFNKDGKFYVVESNTLTITPATVTEYTVTVTETEEDLSGTLTVEFWQTNSPVNAPEKDSPTSMQITAQDAYGEAGIDRLGRLPATGYRADDPVVYWRSRLLPDSERQQSGNGAPDRTHSGTGFTKIRYWEGSWAVYTENGAWMSFNPSEYQLVAYYMNDLNLADEIKIGVSDWGKKGNVSPDHSDTGYVSIVFQVIYEDGTCFPADNTSGTDVGANSYIVNHWGQRGIGTIAMTQIDDYLIKKVTATTGTHTLNENNTIASIQWENNERVLFDDPEHPLSEYTLYNPAPSPYTDAEHENLYWDAQNESILIRMYLQAVETDDSLTVVYYDEKFGATLVDYPVSVPTGSTFKNGIVYADTDDLVENIPLFEGSTTRVDLTGLGIVNNIGKTQNFRTDLTLVPEAVGKYNNDLYAYAGSVISEDGKMVMHYYTIDQTALSPNLVADFGLPISFKLSDVVKDGIGTVVSVKVEPKTKFGELTYTPSANSADGTFTYTPTEILTTIDVLTLRIGFSVENGTDVVTTNVGVTPATTVYYEEGFINWESGWTGAALPPSGASQEKEILVPVTENTDGTVTWTGTGKQHNYGYDPYYATHTAASNGSAATATAIGSRGSFTFVGNGVQVFANAANGSGYVAVEVRKINSDNSSTLISYAMVNTANATNLYGLPVVTLVDLDKMEHGTYTVNITKIMDTNPVYIDGIRIFNTITDADTFKPDLEDNPEFYELRDVVLTALGVATNNPSEDYKTLYEQVFTAIGGESAVLTNDTVDYSQSSNLQTLLDNGPKNELFLNANDTLTFQVKTKRVMQIGLKAPNGTSTTATVTVDNVTDSNNPVNIKTGDISIASSVDMFYTLVGAPADAETTYSVSITNSGTGILSVTDLKICDDPNASFVPFTAEDVVRLLGGEPEVNPEPEKIFADAVLKINVKNLEGTVLGSVELTANGLKDGTHLFTAAEILAAAKSVLPEKHYIADESAVTDVEVIYGGSKPVSVLANEEELADNGFDYEMWQWMMLLIMSQKKTIVAEAGEGGFITNAGATQVRYQTSQTYHIFPNEGYKIEAVLVDGVNVGAVSEYTFNRVQNDHTISAFFSKIETPAAAEKEEPKLPPQSDEKDGKLFSDVSAKAWYHDDVAFVYANELMIGTSDTEFSPETIVNRAMLVTVLWRLEGSPVVDDMAEFKDIPMGEWYTDAVNWAFVNGIVNGYGDDSFGPLNELTREQIMAILNRYAAYKKWTDASVDLMTSSYKHSGWAEKNVLWADTNGMFKGIETDISDLTQAATRAEMAAYLNRFCKNFMD